MQAFASLLKNPIQFDDASTGYAFESLDGRTYVIVQNLQPRVRTATVSLPGGAWKKAADMLTGLPIPLKTSGGTTLTCLLDSEGATVLVLKP